MTAGTKDLIPVNKTMYEYLVYCIKNIIYHKQNYYLMCNEMQMLINW